MNISKNNKNFFGNQPINFSFALRLKKRMLKSIFVLLKKQEKLTF